MWLLFLVDILDVDEGLCIGMPQNPITMIGFSLSTEVLLGIAHLFFIFSDYDIMVKKQRTWQYNKTNPSSMDKKRRRKTMNQIYVENERPGAPEGEHLLLITRNPS